MGSRNPIRHILFCIVQLVLGVAVPSAGCLAQTALMLDTAFGLECPLYVYPNQYTFTGSMLIMDDGKLVVSGRYPYSTLPTLPSPTVRLFPDGTRDLSFAPAVAGNRLIRWGDHFYTGAFARRYSLDGILDQTFGLTQPGEGWYMSVYPSDFDVYDDGSVVMSGTLTYQDPTGQGSWVPVLRTDSTGTYDTVFAQNLSHEVDNAPSVVSTMVKVVSGDRVIISLNEYQAGGQPWGPLVRLHSDGKLDTTFQTPIVGGRAYDCLELEDGKLLLAGYFYLPGATDTLHVIRLLPTGDLDPGFHAEVDYEAVLDYPYRTTVLGITPYGEDHYILTGNFRSVDGVPRGGLAMIRSDGIVMELPMADPGCQGYFYAQVWHQALYCAAVALDGSVYAGGSFLGYQDEEANDPGQYGIIHLVPKEESVGMAPVQPLTFKQPGIRYDMSSDLHIVELGSFKDLDPVEMTIHTALGSTRLRRNAVRDQEALHTADLPAGLYIAQFRSATGLIRSSGFFIH